MVVTSIPNLKHCVSSSIYPVGHIVFKIISQNKNPETLSGLLEVTHLRSGDLVSSHCRPCQLSTRPWCLPGVTLCWKYFLFLIMDCKFESYYTVLSPGCIRQQWAWEMQPNVRPYFPSVKPQSCDLPRPHFPVNKIRSNKTFHLSGMSVLRTH